MRAALEFDATRAAIFRKPDADPALEAARRSPVIQEFLRFAQYPLWRLTVLNAHFQFGKLRPR